MSATWARTNGRRSTSLKKGRTMAGAPGREPIPSSRSAPWARMVEPIKDYGHNLGHCIVGGYVYRGAAIPSLYGVYVYADYSDGWIAGLTWSGSALTFDSAVAPHLVPHQLLRAGQGRRTLCLRLLRRAYPADHSVEPVFCGAAVNSAFSRSASASSCGFRFVSISARRCSSIFFRSWMYRQP